MINSQKDIYTNLDQMEIHIKIIKGPPHVQNHAFTYVDLTLVF